MIEQDFLRLQNKLAELQLEFELYKRNTDATLSALVTLVETNSAQLDDVIRIATVLATTIKTLQEQGLYSLANTTIKCIGTA